MTGIKYVVGDATRPEGDGTKIIAHIVNDIGAWGAGFTGALSRRWPNPEQEYRGWWKTFRLGDVQIVTLQIDLHVANMYAQRDIVTTDEAGRALTRPLDDMSLAVCLVKLFGTARLFGASVHMPRIGCGLAGGKWEDVEPIIQHALHLIDVPVTVYDLKENK